MDRKSPPAYQEYAANILASRWFRQLSYAQKGLLWTLRMECWVNGSLPLNTEKLSKLLGEDITKEFESIKHLLTISKGEFTFDDLEKYRLRANKLSKVRQEVGREGGKAKSSLAIGKQLVSNSLAIGKQLSSNVNPNPNPNPNPNQYCVGDIDVLFEGGTT